MKKFVFFILLTLSIGTSISQTNSTIQVGKPKPFVIGKTFKINSKILNEERTLNIYLPNNYNEKDSTKYSVIYLLDGGANEDFIHIVGLVQFDNFPWVDRLQNSIVIGISNIDRIRDFTFPTGNNQIKTKFPTSGQSQKFISFLKLELQPYIENKYKTNGEKTIIGESLGGLLATEILFKTPTLFNKYIIVSPSLWWNNGSILNEKIKPFKNTKIYLGVGKEGLTPSIQPRVEEVDVNLLADRLKNLKYPGVNIYFDYLPKENHATIMHKAVMHAFRLLK